MKFLVVSHVIFVFVGDFVELTLRVSAWVVGTRAAASPLKALCHNRAFSADNFRSGLECFLRN
jgi:hypothetical protein